VTKRNPFAYPEGMAWLPYMAHSQPGTMIWQPMKNATTGDLAFTFVLREESHVIEALPQLPAGGVLLEWRMGLMAVDVSSGKKVAMIVIVLRTPGGLCEVTVNALHLDEAALVMLDDPIVLILVGDSGSVERSIMFPPSEELPGLLRLGRKIYEKHPWTDPDFDEAKRIFEQTTSLDQLWAQMGKG